MKNVNQVLLMIMAVTVFFMTSCKKDPVDTIEPIDPIEVVPTETTENSLIENAAKMTSTGIDLECITILYPFDVLTNGGNTVTINDSTDFVNALSDPNDYVVDFVYPLDAEDEDGYAIVINDEGELVAAFVSCVPTVGWDSIDVTGFPAFDPADLCVDLVYPVNLTADDGTVITVADDAEFADALALNPILFFEFPINVVDSDGITSTVNDDTELFDALLDCYDADITIDSCVIPLGVEDCFELVYPVDLVQLDSTTITVNDENELMTEMLSGNTVDFSYPLDLLLEDGTTLTVNDENELFAAFIDCSGLIIGYGGYGGYGGGTYVDLTEIFMLLAGSDYCYDINYPISAEMDSSTVTMNNQADIEALWISAQDATTFELNYPVSVTLASDGSTVVLNDLGETLDLVFDCQ